MRRYNLLGCVLGCPLLLKLVPCIQALEAGFFLPLGMLQASQSCSSAGSSCLQSAIGVLGLQR